MRTLLLLCTLALLPTMHPSEAVAGSNADTRIPLHAVVQSMPPPPPPCDLPDPCPDPLLEVEAGSTVRAYLLLRNHDGSRGVQTAFEWGDWQFLFGDWTCQPFQISGTVPHGNGGPFEGTIATAFDCILGGDTAIVGWMQFLTGTDCLEQVQSSFPDGNHLLDCDTVPSPIVEANWGSICVGSAGVNTCVGADNGTDRNEFASLPMHALVLQKPPPEPCAIVDPCEPGPPLVNVPPNSAITTYVMLRAYDDLRVLQTAFDWGDWQFVNGVWSCLPGQVTIETPEGAGGPDEGTLATIFDCITGGSTAVVGSMNFITSGQGCLTQVTPVFPKGIFVANCDSEPIPVLPENLGSICVDAGGIDACGDGPVAVRPTTWGGIKASFR